MTMTDIEFLRGYFANMPDHYSEKPAICNALERITNVISDSVQAWQTATGCATVEEARQDAAAHDARLAYAERLKTILQGVLSDLVIWFPDYDVRMPESVKANIEKAEAVLAEGEPLQMFHSTTNAGDGPVVKNGVGKGDDAPCAALTQRQEPALGASSRIADELRDPCAEPDPAPNPNPSGLAASAFPSSDNEASLLHCGEASGPVGLGPDAIERLTNICLWVSGAREANLRADHPNWERIDQEIAIALKDWRDPWDDDTPHQKGAAVDAMVANTIRVRSERNVTGGADEGWMRRSFLKFLEERNPGADHTEALKGFDKLMNAPHATGLAPRINQTGGGSETATVMPSGSIPERAPDHQPPAVECRACPAVTCERPSWCAQGGCFRHEQMCDWGGIA